jgi:hypothetical protein
MFINHYDPQIALFLIALDLLIALEFLRPESDPRQSLTVAVS